MTKRLTLCVSSLVAATLALASAAEIHAQAPTDVVLTNETDTSVASSPTSQNARRDKESNCSEIFTYTNALLRAENAYVRRRYQIVIDTLKPIYEKVACIDDPNAVIEIDLLLGVSNYESGDAILADTFFLNVLRSDPDHEIGSVITLPESSVRRLEHLRSIHEEELSKLREKRTPGVVIESLYVLAETKEHPYWINFLPFGAGQFQMNSTTWGAVYAATQAAALALTITGGAMVEYYRGPNFTYSAVNYAQAKNWQNAQITGIAIFAASYIAGVIHALIIHEPTTVLIHPPSQTRPDTTHAAAPFFIPNGAGIVYETTF